MRYSLPFWLLWVAFVAYAFLLAPPDNPDETWALIQNLSTGNIEGINPVIVALFNLMGIWPIIYGCLLFIDGRSQRIWAFPFAIAAFAVGAFALLPYLALRKPRQPFVGEKNWFLAIQDSRWLALALTLGALPLLGFAILQGDWAAFFQQWQTSRFIHVMTLDFCMLWLLFPVLMVDDMAKRGMTSRSLWWAISFIPMVGALGYLLARSPLPSAPDGSTSPADSYATPSSPSAS